MIDISIMPSDLEYDKQSLVQAFYLGHEFKINSKVESAFRRVIIRFSDNQVNIVLMDNSNVLTEQSLPWNFVGLKDVRRQQKNTIKKYLYKIFKDDTRLDLPWGNLTGIRPVKIVSTLKNQNYFLKP